MTPPTLPSGSCVAVVGGGIAGLASALSVMAVARSRGMRVQVDLYSAAGDGGLRPPLLLTPECRLRLTHLGCPLPEHRLRRRRAEFLLCEGGRTEALPLPPGTTWVLDEEGGDEEQNFSLSELRRTLEDTVAQSGVRIVNRRVTELVRERSTAPTQAGPWLLTAGGRRDRYHGVLLAPGVSSGLNERLFGSSRPAPGLPGVVARIRTRSEACIGAAKAYLAPVQGVDALVLVPNGETTTAFAFGPTCTVSDFCEALMMAARDGHLEEGFDVEALDPCLVPAGRGQALAEEARFLVGGAAFGVPLSGGVRHALATAQHAATAVLNQTGDDFMLGWSFESDLLGPMLNEASLTATALRWFRRIRGPRIDAWVRAQDASALLPYDESGLWGPRTPTLPLLKRYARRASVRSWFASLIAGGEPPAAPRVRPPGAPPLVYIVDDDEGTRSALARGLEMRGAQVVCFGDELSLLGAVSRQPPDALLLDVVLHHLDGLRLCARIREALPEAQSRIFVMSGLDLPHVRAGARDAGADAFFSKPLDVDRLWRRLCGQAAEPIRPTSHRGFHEEQARQTA